jgi:hypothetical protein
LKTGCVLTALFRRPRILRDDDREIQSVSVTVFPVTGALTLPSKLHRDGLRGALYVKEPPKGITFHVHPVIAISRRKLDAEGAAFEYQFGNWRYIPFAVCEVHHLCGEAIAKWRDGDPHGIILIVDGDDTLPIAYKRSGSRRRLSPCRKRN